MLSFVLAVAFPIAFVSAATITNQSEECFFDNIALNVYQNPNASNSYSIPAVVSTDSPITNSTTKTWQIIHSVGTVLDPANLANPQAEQLANYIFLDTSSTVNASSSSSPLPIAGCSFTFGLPSGDIGKASADGNCANIFGQSCLNEITQIAQDSAATIPLTAASSGVYNPCTIVTEAVNNYIQSSKTCNPNGPTIAISQGLDFSPITDNCTNPPTPIPFTLFEQHDDFQQGNYTTYDQWTRTATPVLLTFFVNGTMSGGGVISNFTNTYLTCTSPTNVTKGSHDPTSTADRSAKAAVGLALAINALVFLML